MVTPEKIFDIANAFSSSRVLLTAYELDIFSVLEGKKMKSSEVSAETGTEARATDRLMNALTGLGFLNKREGYFTNTESSSRFLVKGKSSYMEGLAHIVNLWDNWSTLTEAVTKGSCVKGRQPINERGNEWLDAFIAAMHARGFPQGQKISKLLDFSSVKRVLDVGGGSGAYVFGFISENPGLKAVIYDLPNVIPITEEYIKKEGFENTVTTNTGNYLTDDIGKGFDMMFLSAVIHSNSPEDNLLLFKKCYDGLNNKGQLVVLDNIMDEDRIKPLWGAMFALNMLVGTEKGDTYTESEVSSWMESAGFRNISRKDTEFNTALIIGIKQ